MSIWTELAIRQIVAHLTQHPEGRVLVVSGTQKGADQIVHEVKKRLQSAGHSGTPHIDSKVTGTTTNQRGYTSFHREGVLEVHPSL